MDYEVRLQLAYESRRESSRQSSSACSNSLRVPAVSAEEHVVSSDDDLEWPPKKVLKAAVVIPASRRSPDLELKSLPSAAKPFSTLKKAKPFCKEEALAGYGTDGDCDQTRALGFPLATPQPEIVNTFRNFQHRYPEPAPPRPAQKHRRNGPEILDREAQRRRLVVEARTDATEAAPPVAVPGYRNTLGRFIEACAYLEGLLRANDTALHQSLWDDFVRFYSTVWVKKLKLWKQEQEKDQKMLSNTEQLPATRRVKALAVSMEPPLSMYCQAVLKPIYTGSVLSPASLLAALREHPQSTKNARIVLAQHAAILPQEGSSFQHSRLWQSR